MNRDKYINRDISWLSFNYRVLQEARDEKVPILERLKFMAIFSNNLDEFFRVRVSNHRNLIRSNKKTIKQLDINPSKIFKQIIATVNNQMVEFSHIFRNQIIPALSSINIELVEYPHFSLEQKKFIENYFEHELCGFLQPIIIQKNKIKLFLENGAIYLVCELIDKETKMLQYALVHLPSDHLSRFLVLPSSVKSTMKVTFLDEIVRDQLNIIFPGYNIISSHSIKLTRDAELNIDDEYSGNLIDKIKKSLNKRKIGLANRMVYDRKMPNKMLQYLMETLELEEFDLLPEGRYHNNSDLIKFPSFKNQENKYVPWSNIHIPELEANKKLHNLLTKRDFILHYPYHSYDSVVTFFEQAATDPTIKKIEIIQYRVSKSSKIMNALIMAAQAGKEVTAFVEIKARFDEQTNLYWGQKLEKAGVRVVYSLPGIKVHGKIALITKIVGNRISKVAYLSTGNFHEDTARLYSDIGLFTSHKAITKDCTTLFNYICNNREGNFEVLKVGQFNLNEFLENAVSREIENAKLGKKAHITLKMNSLQDNGFINLLYNAANNGVKIDLIIRGICSLVVDHPYAKGNIRAVSIIDRYLEHSRIFVFHNQGNPEYYLSSADWMARNLHRRIEVVFPVLGEKEKEFLAKVIEIQLNDNQKARLISNSKNNHYVGRKKGQAKIQSQQETYNFVQQFSKNYYSFIPFARKRPIRSQNKIILEVVKK